MTFSTIVTDLIPRIALVCLYGYFGAQSGSAGLQRLGGAVTHGWFSEPALQIYPLLGKSVFMLVIAVLAVVRFKRVAADTRLYAQSVALAGTFFMLLVPWISPRAVLTPTLAISSSLLLIAGSIASIMVVTRLGQSFSIMPEARRLVVSGPYRIVRHPLYLAEELMMIGAFLTFPLGWTIFMFFCHGLLQLERMRLEERVLTDAFPEYRRYAATTARIIPGIY